MPRAQSVLGPMVGRGADGLAIANGSALVLAVSGGPDSTALLHGAATEAPSRGWALTVAHLDHALRPESADDAAFVAEAATRLGLPVEMRRTDVTALAAGWKVGIEEAGRRARYAFLDEVAAAAGPDALVVTAHTADDQAETILLHLVRGAGQAGVRGMPARRGRVVRPLLGERRATLRSALDAAGIAYRDDPTNLDVGRSRARVRGVVLPALAEINPTAVEALLRHRDLAAADDALLDDLAAAELARRRGPDGSIDWRQPPPPALARRVLRLAVGEPAPAAERILALDEAARGPRGGLTIQLGGGRSAEIRQRRIQLLGIGPDIGPR